MAEPVKAPKHLSCVVCGQGSHREKWARTHGEFVACDHHEEEEIKKAVAAKKPTFVTPATHPGQTKPPAPVTHQTPTTHQPPQKPTKEPESDES